jgi:hypothetical protein
MNMRGRARPVTEPQLVVHCIRPTAKTPASLHLHNNLPAVLVPLHLPVRCPDLRPREHLVHVRLQLTVPLGARQLADDVAREALDEVRLVRHVARGRERGVGERRARERAEGALGRVPRDRRGRGPREVRGARGLELELDLAGLQAISLAIPTPSLPE